MLDNYRPKQDGYKAFSPAWFTTNGAEMSKVHELSHKEIVVTPAIVEYSISGTNVGVKRAYRATIKNEYKRSKNDSAKLLILVLEDDTVIAKRFNNNQYFKL